MADWSALAGFAGLASALSDIQDRRLKEAQLQRQLMEGQGTWAPLGDRPSGWDMLDQFLGYSRPGQASFGGQRYGFTPHPLMTEQDVIDLDLTRPQTTTTPGQPSMNLAPPGAGFGRPAAELVQQTPDMTFRPAETTAYPFVSTPGTTTTRNVALPGFVGRPLDPKMRDLILQEKLKQQFERFKIAEQQKLFDRLDTPGSSSTDTGGATFDLPGTGATTPTPTQTPTPTATGARTSQATPAITPAATPVAQGAVPGIENVSPQFLDKLTRIATNLGARPEDLLRVMSFETAGSFSPSQPNIGGTSSGTGLIQFLSKTAKGLGTTTEALAAMTPEQQLDYVEKYLTPYKGKIGTLQDLYMAILSPTSIGKSGNAVVFSKDKTPAEYAANAPLDVDKKGYVTVSDATNAVMRKTGSVTTAQTQASPTSVTQTLPPGSVQVAGPGAGTPPPSTSPASEGTQPTSGTVPLSPQEPFALTPEGRQRIESNNRRTLANNQRIQALDVERRRVQAGIRAGMPGMTDRLNALEASVRALRLENTNFYDDSQKTLGEEQKEWRARLQRQKERGLRPGEVAAEERAREEEKQRFRQGQNLYDAVKDDATLFRDTTTGQPVDETLAYRDVQVAQKRMGEGGVPQVVRVSKEAEKRLDVLKEIEPAVQQIRDNLAVLYGPGGPLRGYERGVGQTANLIWEQIWQSRPELQAMRRNMEGQLQNLARAFGGARGDLNAQELEAARGMISQLGAKLGFEITFGPQVGTRGLGVGFGIKLAPTIPDSADVGTRTMNEFLTSFNQRIGAILRNPGYSAVPPWPMPERLTPDTRSRLLDMTPAQIRSAPAAALADVKTLDDLKGTDFTADQKKAITQRLRDRLREQAARVDLPTGRPRIPGLPPGRWAISP